MLTHHDSIVLSFELAVMLAVGLIAGQLMARLRMPIVVGELLGGIVLGPTVLGRFAPHLFATLFPKSDVITTGRQTFIQLGLLCFLFAAGLEMNFADLKRLRRHVLWTSSFGILLPFALGFAMVLGRPSAWTTHTQLAPFSMAIFMGTALSISALPVIARVLMDLRLARHAMGTIVLASATLDDLVGWSLFAAILASFAPGSPPGQAVWRTVALIFVFAGLSLTIGRAAVGRSREWVRAQIKGPGGHITIAAIVWLSGAMIAEWIGVHAVVGAFLAGVMLAPPQDKSDPPTEVIHNFAIGVFAPIYFVSIGLRTDFAAHFQWGLVLVVLLVACAGKIGGASVGARIAGSNWREALAIGFGLNARGAMEIILASIALEKQLIDEHVFVALVVMALVTSVLSGPAMSRLLNSAKTGQEVPVGSVSLRQ